MQEHVVHVVQEGMENSMKHVHPKPVPANIVHLDSIKKTLHRLNVMLAPLDFIKTAMNINFVLCVFQVNFKMKLRK